MLAYPYHPEHHNSDSSQLRVWSIALFFCMRHEQLVLQPRYRLIVATANTQSETISAREFEEDDEADVDPAAADEDRLVELVADTASFTLE
ncbi:hypothetical protein V1508DRAFT_398917 [Lipomyces doorenjongii]|uniref:uncharacterized protein n=1 Tax=Lipomyces doorenjongii TaxID=383834 RepID=UPI0034CF7E00